MNGWLEFARGPLFMVTFLIMLIGLARHVFLQLHLLATKGRKLKWVRWRMVAVDTLSWAMPVRHLVRGTVLLTLVSMLFHVGVVLVPLLLGDHVALWSRFLGLTLPSLNQALADTLTLITIGCILVLFGYRLLIPRSRALSSPGDYLLLILVLAPFVSGYLASHPSVNPLPWTAMMLIHTLSAELLFVLVPFTKLAHVVLFPFDRLSQVHWQLRPEAGGRVAKALYGQEVKV
jgi:nitrate reductase gamma subunit